MLQVLIKFLTLQVTNIHPAMYWGMGFVWFLLLIAAFSSVMSLDISKGAKAGWLFLIFLVPIGGLAIYCLRCLFRGNWFFLKPIFSRPHAVKVVNQK